MKKLKPALVVLIAAAVLGSGIVAAADVKKVIEARQAFMKVYAFNLGLVGDMAKGKTEYDAEAAANAANNLLSLAKMKNGPMWPQGSSNEDSGLARKTRALPEIWSNYPKVAEKHEDLTAALEKLVDVAGKDLAGLRGGMKAVGEGCKGCHKSFRAEKK